MTSSKLMPIYLTREKLPDFFTPVIVEGGIAVWTGDAWETMYGREAGRPIQREVKWWSPLIHMDSEIENKDPEFDSTAKPIWEEFHELTKDLTDEDMLKSCRDWKTEIFFVAMPRSDGGAPGIEKAVSNEIYFSIDEAHEAREHWCLMDEKFRVFSAIVSVKRAQ